MGSKLTMDKYQKIVTTGCLIRDGKVLLIKRTDSEEFLPGYYELPGGKCDFGEDPTESLKREFMEEVGLKIIVIKPYKTFSYISDGDKRHTVEIMYLVKEEGKADIALGKDQSDYAWLGKNELNNFKITDQIKESIIQGFENLEKNK